MNNLLIRLVLISLSTIVMGFQADQKPKPIPFTSAECVQEVKLIWPNPIEDKTELMLEMGRSISSLWINNELPFFFIDIPFKRDGSIIIQFIDKCDQRIKMTSNIFNKVKKDFTDQFSYKILDKSFPIALLNGVPWTDGSRERVEFVKYKNQNCTANGTVHFNDTVKIEETNSFRNSITDLEMRSSFPIRHSRNVIRGGEMVMQYTLKLYASCNDREFFARYILEAAARKSNLTDYSINVSSN